MSTIEQAITDYLVAWNATDLAQRHSILERVLADNCIYADSHLPDTVNTREQHSEFISRFKDKFPQLQMSLSGSADIHHQFFRFNWQLLQPDGSVFSQGVFFGEIDKCDRITKLIGFVN